MGRAFREFIEIKVEKDGAGSYDIRQLSEDADPQPLQIGAAVREKIFDLAAQLHNFTGSLRFWTCIAALPTWARKRSDMKMTARYRKIAISISTINHEASRSC